MHLLVIRLDSRVRLFVETMRDESSEDPEKTIYGFGIKARVDLEADEWLFELAGLVPTSACKNNTSLSTIQRSNHHQS